MAWLRIIVAVFISVILPFLIDSFVALSANEKVLLGIATFIVVSLIEIHLFQDVMKRRIDTELQIIDAKNRLATSLTEIQQHYSRLLEKAGSENDLFVQGYKTELEDVLSRMRKTIGTGEFAEDRFHLVHTDILLNVFRETSADEYADIFVLDDEYDVFDDYSLNYFVKKMELISSGKLRSIRSIFVIDSKGTPIEGDLAKTLAFYERKKGLDYVLLDRALYEKLFIDSLSDRKCVDFALYGNRYLYKTISYEPTIEGVFTNSDAEIAQFRRFFEACWSSAAAWRSKDLSKDGSPDVSHLVKQIQFQSPTRLEHHKLEDKSQA